MLEIPGAYLAERGRTYLVFSPLERRRYSPTQAVVLSVAIALAALIATAASVVLICLLPLAVVPLIPLLFTDHPLLAVGAVEECRGSTWVTVHGQAWGEMSEILDNYVKNLPPAAEPGAERGAPNGSAGAVAYEAASSHAGVGR
jgi:hypothetical protein